MALSPYPTLFNSVLTPYTLSKIRTFQINHYGRSQRPRVAAVVPVSAGRGRATLNRTRAVRAVYNRAERSRRVRAQSPIREHARLAGRDGRPVRARGASGRKHHGGPGAERRSCSAKCNAPRRLGPAAALALRRPGVCTCAECDVFSCIAQICESPLLLRGFANRHTSETPWRRSGTPTRLDSLGIPPPAA